MTSNNPNEAHTPLTDTPSSTASENIEATQGCNETDKEQSPAKEITREQLSLRKRLLSWRTIVPLVIVIAALIFFAWRTDLNPQKTWAAIRSASPIFFAAAFAIYYFSFSIRAWRWRLLLRNAGYTQANGIHLPRSWKLAEIILVSFFANTIVPAKLGDVYRAYLLRQETNVPTSRSFGTVLAERMLDLVILLLLFIPAIIISLHRNLPSQLLLSLELLFAVVVVGIACLFILSRFREKLAKLVPVRFREHYYHLQEGTLGSFRQHLHILTGFTVCIWACEALRFFFIATSLHLIDGDVTHVLAAATFIGLGEALLTAVPTTGGGIGLVETGMVGMIALFSRGGNGVNLAVAAILLDRTISLFSVLIVGFIIFLIMFSRKAATNKSLTEI
ncbi:MAG TPA: lysylphosphatidylglycerol synthase transmembrane domain-containing protein [Ktedonobacteraceae bacterium]